MPMLVSALAVQENPSKIPKLSKKIQKLMLSFESSEFYLLQNEPGCLTLCVKPKYRETYNKSSNTFFLGLKFASIAHGIAINSGNKTNLLFFVKHSTCCAVESTGDFSMPAQPRSNINFVKSWETTEKVVASVFEDVYFLLCAAKSLEKQSKYFVSRWSPRVLSKVWVSNGRVVEAISKRELRRRIEKRYEERVLREVRLRLDTVSTIEEARQVIAENGEEKKAEFVKLWMDLYAIPEEF